MPEKNQVCELTIDKYGNSGEGIGRLDGYTLFVKGALPGERVRVIITKTNKKYGYARLLSVEEASPERVRPRCPVAKMCGGCDLQHIGYEEQLRFKTERVRECLERIGGVAVDSSIAAPERIKTEVIGCENPEGEYVPWYYRNKAQFPVGTDENGVPLVGFFASRSHRIIPCEHCLLQDSQVNRMLSIVMSYLRELDREWRDEMNASGAELSSVNGGVRDKQSGVKQNRCVTTGLVYDETTHTGWLRNIYIRRGYATNQTLICLVVNDRLTDDYMTGAGSRYHLERLVERIGNEPGMTTVCLNENRKRTNVVMGEKIVALSGNGYIEDMVGRVRYRIAPESFYQVNPHVTKRLYEKALEYSGLTDGAKHGSGNFPSAVVWDLYCGIGTIGLFMAKYARKVIGVEVVPQAIEDARFNARINGITNAEFICGAAEEIIQGVTESDNRHGDDDTDSNTMFINGSKETSGLDSPDIVVLDPPRKGCDEKLLTAIATASPSRIVYVSCDPATLARDIARLAPYGYEVKKVCVVDQFWQTRHVETVCLLIRS
ncbi:MAG: class I SAM-dependent RNA methyltransferase [Eubacterium sp.]|nr:class I SAM-dependent RNA methyltransferase [Eubacterium sp.]